MTPSLTRWKQRWLYGWKMRHADGCHWLVLIRGRGAHWVWAWEGNWAADTCWRRRRFSRCFFQGPNVTAIILTEGLQLTDDVISHFLKAYHFIRTCLKFMHKMEVVMAQHEEVYTDIQKETQLLKTTSFFSTSSVSRHRRPFSFLSPWLLSVRINDVISANTNTIFLSWLFMNINP